MKKINMKRLFDNDRFLQVFSLAAAALSWLIVAMTQSYTTVEIIKSVPVKIDTQSSALESIGLHAIESGDNYVDVKVEGLRSVVGQLKPEDFLVTAKVTDVTEAGSYDLALSPAKQIPNADYEIVSIYPPMVNVWFDRIEKRSFKIKEEINGLAIAPGYTEKATVITPGTVNIEGPTKEIEKISRCSIKAELENPLDKTFAADLPILLYDVNGDLLDPGQLHLTMDKTEVQLMIQILKVTNLPLEIEFNNIPRGFPQNELLERVRVSQLDVTIAGPADLIDKTTEIKLGYISVKNITLENDSFYFDVPLPTPSDQFMRLDNVTSTVVTIDDYDLTSVVFNVPAPQIINAPVGFDVKVLAQTIYGVEFIGESEIFETMTADDIMAEIDLSERELVSGSYNVPVKISVPDKGLVWAAGDHSVTIQVTDNRTP